MGGRLISIFVTYIQILIFPEEVTGRKLLIFFSVVCFVLFVLCLLVQLFIDKFFNIYIYICIYESYNKWFRTDVQT